MSEHTDLYSTDLRFVLAARYDEKGGRQTTTMTANRVHVADKCS